MKAEILTIETNKKLALLERENEYLKTCIYELKEEIKILKSEPVNDPYEFYGVSRSDFI